ncbi:MAG TPA: carboxymuconolactone decarboxylase family protein, partial [Terriglobales bacterium]
AGRRCRMLDWIKYREEILGRAGELGKVAPETMKGYAALDGAAAKGGHLEAKTRELISLAVAVTTRCDGCITVHTKAAIDSGASKEEIAEALSVAMAMNAGAALVYSTRVLDAFEAYSKQSAAASK